jgi:predicted Fe-Mo cluster-binding NifX family protein
MNFRLAIAVEINNNGDRIVAEHFGRCSEFNVYEFDDEKKIIKDEIYFNPLSGEHNGACQLPGYVKQFNVNAIIAGGMGQKAISNFLNFGIDVITAPGKACKDALDLYLEGKLSGYDSCKHEHHHH